MAAGQGRAGPGTRARGPAGLTKGYSQDHTDFYVSNGRPKKLWLKELAPKACVLMCARELPVACQAAEGDGGGARSPLKVSQLQTNPAGSLWASARPAQRHQPPPSAGRPARTGRPRLAHGRTGRAGQHNEPAARGNRQSRRAPAGSGNGHRRVARSGE